MFGINRNSKIRAAEESKSPCPHPTIIGKMGFFDIGKSLTNDDIGKEFCLAAPVSMGFGYDWSFVGNETSLKLKKIAEKHFEFEITRHFDFLMRSQGKITLEKSIYDRSRWVSPEEYEKRCKAYKEEKHDTEFETSSSSDDEDEFLRAMAHIQTLALLSGLAEKRGGSFKSWYRGKVKEEGLASEFRAFQLPKHEHSYSGVPNLQSDDPFEILGISPSSSMEEVNRRYRSLAKQFHPDQNPESHTEVEGYFKKIVSAYEKIAKRSGKNFLEYDPSVPSSLAISRAIDFYNQRVRKIGKNFECRDENISALESLLQYLECYHPFKEDMKKLEEVEASTHLFLTNLGIQKSFSSITDDPKVNVKHCLETLEEFRQSDSFKFLETYKEHDPKIYAEPHLLYFDKKIALLRLQCEQKLLEEDVDAVKKIYKQVKKIEEEEIKPFRGSVNLLIKKGRLKELKKMKSTIDELFKSTFDEEVDLESMFRSFDSFNARNDEKKESDREGDLDFESFLKRFVLVDKEKEREDSSTKKSSLEVGVYRYESNPAKTLSRIEAFSDLEDNLNDNLKFFEGDQPSHSFESLFDILMSF